MCECCNGASHVHTEVLKIEGMSCGHCKSAVEKAVYSLNGIEKVEVSLEAKEAKVEYNPDLVTMDAVKAVIQEEGYTVK
ncbi:MAG: copper chaperone [Clostridia bacterium]|jgi:copper ion binding protein|nr:copper chaperone [Clostridia bacterium]MDN5323393.1 copper chaperone [Clostridia bacterium]